MTLKKTFSQVAVVLFFFYSFLLCTLCKGACCFKDAISHDYIIIYAKNTDDIHVYFKADICNFEIQN
jgi:hypothetical protein